MKSQTETSPTTEGSTPTVSAFELIRKYGPNPTQMQRLEIAMAAKAKPETTKAKLSVEDIVEQNPTQTVASWETSFAAPKLLQREIRAQGTRTHQWCESTSLRYTYTMYPSAARETIGDLIDGTSVEVMGWDLEQDPEGNLLLTDEKPTRITKHTLADGTSEEITEPLVLMIFRIQWGYDRSRRDENTVRSLDMLNLVPNKGVPRIVNQATTQDAAMAKLDAAMTQRSNRQFETVDYEKIPGLQTEMEQPIKQHQLLGSEELTLIVSKIPVAANAPSNQAAGKGVVDPIKIATASIPKDAFVGSPS